MTITLRPYDRTADYDRIGEFLVETYQPGKQLNWLQPRWEYMHYHPNLDTSTLGHIGVWEADGMIVGVAHYEDQLGDAYFQCRPGYERIKAEMLVYAEAHLRAGAGPLTCWISECDAEFEALAAERGFARQAARPHWVSHYEIPDPFPAIELRSGFRLQSLADENDLTKVHRVMWRGFDHEGEPPAEGLAWRRLMQSAPNFRPEVNIVVVEPDGAYVSFCGMWYDAVNRVAYVEPVATDPAYRRLGLGQAAVLEGIRRCGGLGATVAVVGSGQKFYAAIGFKKVFALYPWVK